MQSITGVAGAGVLERPGRCAFPLLAGAVSFDIFREIVPNNQPSNQESHPGIALVVMPSLLPKEDIYRGFRQAKKRETRAPQKNVGSHSMDLFCSFTL